MRRPAGHRERFLFGFPRRIPDLPQYLPKDGGRCANRIETPIRSHLDALNNRWEQTGALERLTPGPPFHLDCEREKSM